MFYLWTSLRTPSRLRRQGGESLHFIEERTQYLPLDHQSFLRSSTPRKTIIASSNGFASRSSCSHMQEAVQLLPKIWRPATEAWPRKLEDG